MANDSKNVNVELHDLHITERKDDRFGRVVGTGSKKVGDLINTAVKRRTDLNASTLRAAYDILLETALEEISEGASVEFGPGYFSIGVKGVFIGDNAGWDSAVNSLVPRAIPSAAFHNAIRGLSVKMRGMATVGTFINTVTDVASGETNSRLTPGGGANLTGSRMKILEGDEGIKLLRQDSDGEVAIPRNSILVNDPSKISFIVPASVPSGDYKISITTSYSGSGGNALKEPRTFVFDYILAVVNG